LVGWWDGILRELHTTRSHHSLPNLFVLEPRMAMLERVFKKWNIHFRNLPIHQLDGTPTPTFCTVTSVDNAMGSPGGSLIILQIRSNVQMATSTDGQWIETFSLPPHLISRFKPSRLIMIILIGNKISPAGPRKSKWPGAVAIFFCV